MRLYDTRCIYDDHYYPDNLSTCECGEYDNPEIRSWDWGGELGWRINKAPWFGLRKCERRVKTKYGVLDAHIFNLRMERCQCDEIQWNSIY